MKARLLILNHVLLLAGASIYLGTGVSLVFFSFPIAPQLTVDNYVLQFVPQVAAATAFFTPLTWLMSANVLVMLAAEWRAPTRWVPLAVGLALAAATALTLVKLFPLNHEMATPIRDPVRLQQVLAAWMDWNRWRVALWAAEWTPLAWWFAHAARRGRYPAWPV